MRALWAPRAWSRYLTQSAPTDRAPSLEKPGLRRSCAASSVKNPHSVFVRTKDHSVCGLEPAVVCVWLLARKSAENVLDTIEQKGRLKAGQLVRIVPVTRPSETG